MQGKTKPAKFNFESLKTEATSDDPVVRRNMFIDYFERFQEFPSYLFDNEGHADARLSQTIRELRDDPGVSKAMLKGIGALIERIPSIDETREIS